MLRLVIVGPFHDLVSDLIVFIIEPFQHEISLSGDGLYGGILEKIFYSRVWVEIIDIQR